MRIEPARAFKIALKSMFDYFKQVRAELKHVTWPSRRETIVFTVAVIGVSLGTAVYLGLLDYLFAGIIQRII